MPQRTPQRGSFLRKHQSLLATSLVLALVVAGSAGAQDSDGDGVIDPSDNCVFVPNPAQYNAPQTPSDTCGNACDADFDQDGAVGLADVAAVLAAFGNVNSSSQFDINATVPPFYATLYDYFTTLQAAKIAAVPCHSTVPPATTTGSPVIDIEWSRNGKRVGSPTAWVGDELIARFYLENVGGTLGGYTIGVQWDASELDLDNSTEFLPAGFDVNVTPGTTSTAGMCPGIMFGAAVVTTPASGRVKIGEAVFNVISSPPETGLYDIDLQVGPCAPDSIYATDDPQSDITPSASWPLQTVKQNVQPVQYFLVKGNSNGTTGWSWWIEDIDGAVLEFEIGHVPLAAGASGAAFAKEFVTSINASPSTCSAFGPLSGLFLIKCSGTPFAFYVGDEAGTLGTRCRVTGTGLGANGPAVNGCSFNPTIVQSVPPLPALSTVSLVLLSAVLLATFLIVAKLQRGRPRRLS